MPSFLPSCVGSLSVISKEKTQSGPAIENLCFNLFINLFQWLLCPLVYINYDVNSLKADWFLFCLFARN